MIIRKEHPWKNEVNQTILTTEEYFLSSLNNSSFDKTLLSDCISFYLCSDVQTTYSNINTSYIKSMPANLIPLSDREECFLGSAHCISITNENPLESHSPTPRRSNQDESEEDQSVFDSDNKKPVGNDFLFRIIEALTYPFYVIDVKDYTIKMANNAAKIGSLEGATKCHLAIHRSPVPCWQKGHSCPLFDIKKTKKPVILEHMHFDENNDLRLIEVHGYPVFNSDGELIQIIKYGFDITEQKWVENQLSKESRRARLYLDLLAHDIANELQVIQGSAELTKEMLAISDKSDMIPRFVTQIAESVNRCMDLIQKARSTENLPLAPLVERSLTRALVDCVETLSDSFSDYVMEIQGEDLDAIVLADKYLEDLLTNILSNALKHNPSSQKTIWVTITPLGDNYEISVSDNGPGIEDVMKDILFDPKHRFGGLGIHFTLQIIEKYGGRINVRDRIQGKPTEGVEFVIWLPKIRRSGI
jgi:nitrogen-specific signal transduction histidine kinase